jgi:hypothetical protein
MEQHQPIEHSGDGAACSASPNHELIIEALASRRRQRDSGNHPFAAQPSVETDREFLRDAVAKLFQLPNADVTDAFLDEVIQRVTAEAEIDAGQATEYLDHLGAHLRTLNCIEREEVFEYFAAADRVLLELHLELQRSRPRDTRVKQLSVQYALDARRRVDALAHQIDIRPRDNGYEITVADNHHGFLRSIPHPGVVVRDPFACRLFDLALPEPPEYTGLMQFIEMLLGYVPELPEQAIQWLQPITPATAVQVDVDDTCIIVFGRRYVVDLQLVHFMSALLKSPGAWVSSTSLAADPLFDGVRIDRLWKKLPARIQHVIASCTGKGYRLRLELLEELCQKSSIDQSASIAEHGY